MSVTTAAGFLWGLAVSIAVGHWWLGFSLQSALFAVALYALFFILAVWWDERPRPTSWTYKPDFDVFP